MKGSVIPVGYEREPFCPFLGVCMHKAPKIGLQALVQPFGLPVGLRVVRGAHVHGCVRQLEQMLPEIADEYFVSD
jgi:hypothetical protein